VAGVGALDRVVAILDAVQWAPMGPSELARHLELSVPTTPRRCGYAALMPGRSARSPWVTRSV
jgi:hypothetical protein